MLLRVVTATPDRRRGDREKVFNPAMGLLHNGESTIDCIVIDLSETGAKIEFRGIGFAPKRFKLQIHDRQTLFDCETVWSSGDLVGVRFLNMNSTSLQETVT